MIIIMTGIIEPLSERTKSLGDENISDPKAIGGKARHPQRVE
ncbi:hypothetical protein [Mesorhizobium sp. WSM4906]|nr:hypothetical protein [Mesorhizobium sp. WSM4906]WFP76951.1 hypothetical protein QAZ22_03620 [Mesorhizobium sp. WSM4906]